MSKLAAAAMIASALIAVFGNRWVTDPPSPGFVMVDLRWINLLIQWFGFLLAAAAMYVWVTQWRAAGSWSWPAYVTGALLLFYVIEGVPFTYASTDWRTSNVIRAWRRGRDEANHAGHAFASLGGVWRSENTVYELRRDSIAIRRDGAPEETVSERACEFNFNLRYGMSTRHILPATEQSLKLAGDVDGVAPALEITCGNAAYAFLLKPGGSLVAYTMSARGEVSYAELTRSPAGTAP